MGLLRGNVVDAPQAGIVLAGREQGLEDHEKRLTTHRKLMREHQVFCF